MAVFRILEARARPGASDAIAELFVQQAAAIAEGVQGVVFAQALRSGDQLLGVSCWRSQQDMERYLELDATRAFYRRLPPLLMGVPAVRTYEVLRTATGGGQADDDAAAWLRP